MKTLNILVLLTILAVTFSCSDETVRVGSGKYSHLTETSNKLQKNIVEGNTGKSATAEQKRNLVRYLKEINTAFFGLEVSKYNSKYLKHLKTYWKRLDQLKDTLPANDAAELGPYLIEVGQELEKLARAQGVNFDDISWAIYSHDFSDDMKGFATYGTKREWNTGWARDRGYVSATGYGNHATLVSPSFDLTGVRNPAFQIKHSVSVNQNTKSGGTFDRNKILKGVFKARVSLDYEKGNPDINGTWDDVSLISMPKGIDFHTIESPEIDLSNFIGENVTIMLDFNMDQGEFGKHYVTWNVEKFSVLAAGDTLNVVSRPVELYSYGFNDADFGLYQILDVFEGGSTWTGFGFNGGIDFAKIESNGKKTESWLLSPRIDLTAAEMLEDLVVTEVVRNPQWEKLKILISETYNGGNPDDTKDWVEYERTIGDPVEADKWLTFNRSIDLSAYIGKSIVIAFKFQVGAGEVNAWEIGSVLVKGIGKVSKDKYELTYQPIPDPVVIPDTGGEEFFAHSFSDEAMVNFNQVITDGDAAEWKHTTKNGNSFVRISGYSTKKVGSRLLYSNTIDLSGKTDAQIFVRQAINYYYEDAQALNLIRIVAAEVAAETVDPATLEWSDLVFDVVMPGNSFDAIDSGWLTLPEKLQNKKIVVGFIYSTTEKFFPNWDLYEVKLREGE